MIEYSLYREVEPLMHDGMIHKSGRYPCGSGEHPYQHCRGSHGAEFLDISNKLKAEGLTEKEIANYFGISIRDYRSTRSNAINEARAANQATAIKLKNKGYSNTAIAAKMGVNESTVRSWLNTDRQVKTKRVENVSNMLKDEVANHKYIDVGAGVENRIGISRTTLDNALHSLKDEGYRVDKVWVQQVGTQNKTQMQVLVSGDTTYSELLKNQKDISYPGFYADYDSDGVLETLRTIQEPTSVSSDRVMVNYAENGGSDKDGVIEIRRGLDDISLGGASYAQVRIAVDGTHYLKGMAVYADDLPDGVDIRFNTNKHEGTPLISDTGNCVLKTMKDDPDNPFGASISRQFTYTDSDGNEQLSPVNIVNEQGDWDTWSKTLSSQFLSKQKPSLIKQQLDLTQADKQSQFEELCALENPVVKGYLLEQFADKCDTSASDLKAMSLPRQSTKVILPLTDIKDNEIYAPTYKNGEKVALVRHPHAGTFEIPVLTVNNRRTEQGKSIIGADSQDAVGISSTTAAQLSGADFDGDTVIVIPLATADITATSPLKGLADFDPKVSYPKYEGMKVMSEKYKQNEMGRASNLITDMTLQGASESEIARAVRYSMVVIDAVKHELNYKQAYEDNGIASLREKYQSDGGTSTLISRSNATERIKGVRSEGIYVDPDTGKRTYGYNPETGEKVYSTKYETYTNKKGETVERTTKSTRMAEVDDAYILSSGTEVESIYAEYANSLKSLANQARVEAAKANQERVNYSSEAKKEYASEIESIDNKVSVARQNKPVERKAQLLANARIRSVVSSNPDIKDDADAMKKLKTRSIIQARQAVGTTKRADRIVSLTDREWEAIQSGAISTSKMKQIVENMDSDELKKLSMPKSWNGLSPSKKSRILALRNNGYTLSEIADAVGVSTGTVSSVIYEDS